MAELHPGPRGPWPGAWREQPSLNVVLLVLLITVDPCRDEDGPGLSANLAPPLSIIGTHTFQSESTNVETSGRNTFVHFRICTF